MNQEILTEGTVNRNKREKGVTTVEYAIMLVLIAIVVLVAGTNISSGISKVFGSTASALLK